jgi:hypothetical protein
VLGDTASTTAGCTPWLQEPCALSRKVRKHLVRSCIVRVVPVPAEAQDVESLSLLARCFDAVLSRCEPPLGLYVVVFAGSGRPP